MMTDEELRKLYEVDDIVYYTDADYKQHAYIVYNKPRTDRGGVQILELWARRLKGSGDLFLGLLISDCQLNKFALKVLKNYE